MKTDKNKDGSCYLVKFLVPLQDVYGWKFSGKWFDIGSLEQLQEANKEYENKL